MTTDEAARIVAAHMETPETQNFNRAFASHDPLECCSKNGWWEIDQDNHFAWMPRVARLDSDSPESLHWLRLVEETLTEKQWNIYVGRVSDLTLPKSFNRFSGYSIRLIHASAKDKLLALATALKEKL